MKVTEINNSYQVSDIDLYDPEQCLELGKIVADKCVVFVDKANIDEKRLYEIQTSWGDPSRAIINKYVFERRLKGEHWKSMLRNMFYITNEVKDFRDGMARVSYKTNSKGKPTGIFTNGELDWHSDQQATHESQRVIGLMSVSDTEGSQTSFLCTNEMYESLNHEDKSIVDELTTVWAWDGGTMSKELIPEQLEIVKAHMCPVDGMECPLVDQTATGKKGIKYPSHSFSHFRGMSKEESLKYRGHLWSLLDKDEYKWTNDWKDGQIVFMDQNITLHARPTNVKEGNKRTMTRMITHMNKIYENADPFDYVMYSGKTMSHDDFATLVDNQRKQDYYADVA